MEFILIGQPNCGKSTIFNEAAGYQTIASNFPGASMQYTRSEIELHGERITLVDLPGVYSSQTTDDAELESVKYVRNLSDDAVLINVIDASVLSRSLELTIQLTSINIPMVIMLNMMDEAEYKGLQIDADKLGDIFGVPVIPAVGKKGKGVFETFNKAYEVLEKHSLPKKLTFSSDVEQILAKVENVLDNTGRQMKWSNRFIALKLLENDELLIPEINDFFGNDVFEECFNIINGFNKESEKSTEFLIHSARHDLAFRIFENVVDFAGDSVRDIRGKLDDLLMHPVYGYIFLAGILYLIFSLIFTIGNLLEPIFLENFDAISAYLVNRFGENTLTYSILNGFVDGFGGGIGIVIPYLLPFFICLAFLEDTGYLARIAYLIDNLMHQIGLHGLSVIPMILGYGCTVPGILATRILRSPTDKFITATLTTLVPCSARMTVIFGLVGFFISIKAAILIYVLNIIVLGITGKIMSKVIGDVSPGMILEIPRYTVPSLRVLLSKTWFRMREFVVVAWPLLIVGSIVLEVINYYDLSFYINDFMSPFTAGILGLPSAIGITLLFGIMRKELALVLLFSAIGTNNVLEVLTIAQVFSFTIFITFYVPCLATIAALAKELSMKKALSISMFSTAIAVVLAVLFRFVTPVFTSL